MTERHYEDPLRITLKASIPTDDVLCVLQERNIIPDFDVIIRSSTDSGGTDYVAKCRDGVLENCSAHYTYDRQLVVLIAAANHGLGLGDLSARLVLYGYYGQCVEHPEPSLTLYRDLHVRLVDDTELSGAGSELSAEMAASFVTITRPQFHIQVCRNPAFVGELGTEIQEWSPMLADPSKFKIFLLRKRRKSSRGTYWAIPEFSSSPYKKLKMTSWPISATSARQPVFMGEDKDWSWRSEYWGQIRELGGYHLGDVVNIALTDKLRFHNGRRKLTVGFAVFRYDDTLLKWVQCSNTATADILATKNGETIVCANRKI